MRYFIFACLGFWSSVLVAQEHTGNWGKRPNFLFILTDDQPYTYLGAVGDTVIQTPNLDALANEGLLFTNFHITSPVCTPSRASFFLSEYERKHQINFNSGTSITPEAWQDAYPVVLRKNGYYTGYIGKNHVPVGDGGYESGVIENSFDFWYGGHKHLGFYPKSKHPIFRDAKEDTQVEILAEGAMRFLAERDATKAFCLTISFNVPHDAGTESMQLLPGDPAVYRDAYRDITIPLVRNYTEKQAIVTPKLPADILHAGDRQSGYDYVDDSVSVKERTIRKMQTVSGIDLMMGRVMDRLKQLGIADHTIIIFTSDHGQFMGEFGLGGKALCYEVCTHVPMFVFNPLLPDSLRSRRNDALVQSIDIAPTLLSLAGSAVPESYQGKDLSGIFNGTETDVRDYLFTENLWSTSFGNPRCEAVQDKRWKYIRYYRNDNISSGFLVQGARELAIPVGSLLYGITDLGLLQYRKHIEAPFEGETPVFEELFDLANDGSETINLAGLPEYASLLEEMRVNCQQKLAEARGKGPARVLRYTVESVLNRKD